MSRYNEITALRIYVGLLIVLIVTTVVGVACAPSRPASPTFAPDWTDAGGGLQYRDSGAYRCFRMTFATTVSCVAR